MNLPSIFKNPSSMKGKHQIKKITPQGQPPQDMFGLGIQVFKIDSKKDTAKTSQSGKARQNMRNIENPSKNIAKTPLQIPKPKKISGLLPTLDPDQQQEIKISKSLRADSLRSKKKVEQRVDHRLEQKTDQRVERRIASKNKIQSIKEVLPVKKIAQFQANGNKNTSANNNKIASHLNKTFEPKQTKQAAIEEEDKIIKLNWREGMNQLTKFYTQCEQMGQNEQTKIGRKKNIDYLGDQACFVDAYCSMESFFYQGINQYEPDGIQEYGERGFNHKNYQNYSVE